MKKEKEKVVGPGIIAVSSREPQQSRSRLAVSVPRTNTISVEQPVSYSDVQNFSIERQSAMAMSRADTVEWPVR